MEIRVKAKGNAVPGPRLFESGEPRKVVEDAVKGNTREQTL